jgi:hypothetical protein
MKNDGNATSSPTTKTNTAKTTALAASIGTRRGTASRLARIMPVAYSPVITSTPRTQMVSWLSWKPEPRIVLTGSAMSWRCWLGSALSHCDTVSQMISVVKPRVSTTSSPNEAAVERTERSLVHSDSSSRPKRTGADAGAADAGGAGATAVIGCPPRAVPRSWSRPAGRSGRRSPRGRASIP